MSFSAPTPLQEGIAAALNDEPETFYTDLASQFESNFKLLAASLTKLGAKVCSVDGEIGGYFLVADVSGLGKTAIEFCKWLAEERKVACVPLDVFYEPRPADSDWSCSLVRFAICKQRETIEEACKKIDGTL